METNERKIKPIPKELENKLTSEIGHLSISDQRVLREGARWAYAELDQERAKVSEQEKEIERLKNADYLNFIAEGEEVVRLRAEVSQLKYQNGALKWKDIENKSLKTEVSEQEKEIDKLKTEKVVLEKDILMKVAASFYGIGAVGWDMNPHITWEQAWNNFLKDGTLPPSEWRGRMFGKGRWDTMKVDLELSEQSQRIQELEGWLWQYREELKSTNVFHANQGLINTINKLLPSPPRTKE